MINNTVLVGRLTADADLKYTQNNVAVATFTLAVNRNFKNKDGGYDADFIRCVAYRQNAENLANWVKKGALIGITGRIQTRNYENQQGQRVYVTEVITDSFQLMQSKKDAQAEPIQQNNYRPQPNYSNNGSNPFGQPLLWTSRMMIYHSKKR